MRSGHNRRGRGGHRSGDGLFEGFGRGRDQARHHAHHNEGEGHRRRKRLFDPGALQLLLLKLIADRPRHGYELIREIEERSHGGYSPSPGVVYPALTFMEEAGWIAVEVADSARKSYQATEAGLAHIEAHADEIAAAETRLASLARMRERTDAAPIRRAMQNLKTAIFDRLSHDKVERETVLRVAELIDDAARQIERIEA
ncbi:PadR family transcriptional regulator [Tsuneonella sp. CC-YZS046]|uniref:PadR family transcriptional regulator n=1 Tax=Tsuneonella sp. CC-YZS046 TaxID=3042152 RepID=UPI002D7903D5|nr:PadR family transcriptional regulator [Tsuneonella sp. CC-YZS046]WRO68130.1 PadR family transcriptional regulator [Tsuneonella sp. CC-YZS046]